MKHLILLCAALAVTWSLSANDSRLDTERRNGGPISGSSKTVERVSANSTDSYIVKFWGNEKAEVIVIGDGDTDLDLYIYDSNDNLIVCDTDYTDDCYCTWTPAWTGSFTIKIRNRGDVYNEYTMYVW